MLLGFVTGDSIDALWPASAYNITTCTIELAIASDDIPYDPTPDTWSTHHPDGPTDNDAGRPTIISGAAFRNGWDSWSFGSQTATMDFVMDHFPEDRVVLGSDWPVCEGAAPGSHAKYVAEVKGYLVGKRGYGAAKKLLSENAIRVYRL